MGRAVFGLLLGFVLVFGVAYWARTCLPDPNEEEIDWLHREDVIVVQMKTIDQPDDELWQRLAVPEFTLYGDGTLLFRDPTHPTSNQVFQAQLSDKTIRSLLKSIQGAGMLEYAYDQPLTNDLYRSTTYLYFNTLLGTNAISAYGLASASPSDSAELERLRALKAIHQRLTSIAREGTANAQEYEFTEVLQLGRVDGAAGLSEYIHTGDDAAGFRELFATGKGSSGTAVPEHGDGRVVEFGYRPVLPYEENFPEFNRPAP